MWTASARLIGVYGMVELKRIEPSTKHSHVGLFEGLAQNPHKISG